MELFRECPQASGITPLWRAPSPGAALPPGLRRPRGACRLPPEADPNSALYDPFHRGYTAIICLTLATPTRDGEPIARAIDALVRAGPAAGAGRRRDLDQAHT